MSPTRRTLLTTGSTALLSALAGCSLSNNGREQIPVELRNETESAHDFSVQVRFQDEALLSASTSLDPGESTSYRFAVPQENKTVTVAATADHDREDTDQVDVGPSAGTQYISIVLQADGQLAIGTAEA